MNNKLIISGGGHDEAGGFTAKKEYLSNIEEFLKKEYENLNIKNYSYFDAYTVFPKKNSTILNDLKSLEPFGKENPEPIFSRVKTPEIQTIITHITIQLSYSSIRSQRILNS